MTTSLKPPWLKKRIQWSALQEVDHLNKKFKLNTVCESAACPNRSECWGKSVATFMILGNTCTRNCGFCKIDFGKPDPLDVDEPMRVAKAALELNLKHVVVTSVARDDLLDQGANQFKETIKQIRILDPKKSVEVLTPDFRGKYNLIKIVVDAKPEIFNHNIETVRRLTSKIRFKATYECTLDVLRKAKEIDSSLLTKSGLMLGLGESEDEVKQTMIDLRDVGCDLLTIGQYLSPSQDHLNLIRYVPLEEFKRYEIFGKKIGFKYVASSPYVRSSYNADETYQLINNNMEKISKSEYRV